MERNINILSIDFDWVMEPSIEFYNEIADSRILLDDWLKRCPGITVKPDYKKIKQLLVYVNNIVKFLPNKDRIVFRTEHTDIVDAIENVWNLKDKKYNIYNIDHHHDCGYHISSLDDVDRQELGCGNWVIFCDGLNEYTWINNKDSYKEINNEVFNRFHKFTQSSDISVIDFVNFDYVYICLSPGWVPSELFPLYDLFEFNINTIFSIKGESVC